MGRSGGTRDGGLGPFRSSRASRHRLIRRCSRLGCDYAASAELPRLGGGRDRRLALIDRLVELVVRARALNMLGLQGRRRSMCRTGGRLFLRARTGGESATAAVIAHVVYCDVIYDHRLGVDVGDVGDIVHGPVVEKGS